MGQTTDVLRFEPKVFVEQGDMVATFGDYECRSRATGRAASSEWAMRFDVRNGKVIRFQAFVDTAALASAYQSSAASASQ
jgi:ketosteroid isomerase-like protein